MSARMPEPHQLFAALADPTRVKILLLVEHLQLAVRELADVLDQSQPRVSRHIRILAEAGLVSRHKEGAFVFVGLAGGEFAGALAALAGRMASHDPIERERARLAQVRAARQQAIDDWFQANAGEWDLLRRMGGASDEIEAALQQAARAGAIGRLLDIGTGTGRLLQLLAGDAETATGVDRSPEMLRLARGNLLHADGRQEAELRQADMHGLPFADASFDTVTMLYVLHFSDDPQGALAEAARVLAPGGRLLVADYAAHEHEELRSRFRHARLGFPPDSVVALLAAAGLSGRVVTRHEGPELATILWEGRK